MKRGRKTIRQGGGSPSGSQAGSARGGGSFSTARHGSVVYRHTGGVNAPMGERLEAFGMQRAEEEQCGNSDKFWGIDKESEDRARDRVLMQREFELSSTHEQHCKVIQLQQVRKRTRRHLLALPSNSRSQGGCLSIFRSFHLSHFSHLISLSCLHTRQEWEKQYQRQQHDDAYAQALREMQTRREYMRALFTSGSSEEVMRFVWSADQQVLPRTGASPQRLGHPEARGRQEDSTYSATSGIESLQRLLGGSAFELPQADQEYRPSLHLDGLQQSKALASGEAQTLGVSLRNRSSAAGLAEAAMSSSRKPPTAARSSSSSSSKASSSRTAAGGQFVGGGIYVAPVEGPGGKSAFRLTMPNGNTAMLPPPAGRRHIEALDGHPSLGWDQEALLAQAFAVLDSRAAGYLTLDEVMAVSTSAAAAALLRFTVLGSFLKRRDAGHFRNAFAAPDTYLTMDEWMALAHASAHEEGVQLLHVRTDEEHMRISKAALGPGQQGGDSGWQALVSPAPRRPGQAGWFADQARDHLGRAQREGALQRRLQRGDVVWALHGRGVTWLQAVVEKVGNGTVDLSYPLHQTTVNRHREAQVTNRLVSSAAPSNNQHSDSLSPFDLSLSVAGNGNEKDDLALCGALFDVLSGRFEAMPARMLVAGLFLAGVRSFIEAHPVLRTMAPDLPKDAMEALAKPSLEPLTDSSSAEEKALEGEKAYPPLCRVLLKAYAGEDIQRSEFVAFCALVADRSLYMTV